MTQLPKLLKQLDEHLAALPDGEEHKGRPGLPRDIILEKLSAVGLVPPEEVIELFSWHNGPDGHEREFTPSFRPFSLEEGIERYEMWMDLELDYLRGWLPIFQADGSCGVADCRQGGERAELSSVDRECDIYLMDKVGDLSTVVQWWNDAYATGAWGLTMQGGRITSYRTPQEVSQLPAGAVHTGYVM